MTRGWCVWGCNMLRVDARFVETGSTGFGGLACGTSLDEADVGRLGAGLPGLAAVLPRLLRRDRAAHPGQHGRRRVQPLLAVEEQVRRPRALGGQHLHHLLVRHHPDVLRGERQQSSDGKSNRLFSKAKCRNLTKLFTRFWVKRGDFCDFQTKG